MIVKEAVMRSTQRESIANLDEYLSHGKSRKIAETDRVAYSFTANTVADNPHDARIELDATARCNRRAKSSKFLHLIISNKAGEHLSCEQWQKTAQEMAAALNMQQHQFIAYVHKDTDHEHMHLVICKVHPETYKLNVMSFGWSKLSDTAARLEHEFALSPDNHLTVNTKAERQSQAIERVSGQQSFFSYIAEFKDQLFKASTWAEFHEICAEHSVAIKKSGRGMVFTTIKDDREVCIKASAVDRSLSFTKLEKKYGEYTPYAANLSTVVPVSVYEGKPAGFSLDSEDKKFKQIYAAYKTEQINNQRSKTFLTAAAYKKFRKNKAELNKLKRQAYRALKIAYGKRQNIYTAEKQRFDELFDKKEKSNREDLKQDLSNISSLYPTATYLDWLKNNRDPLFEKQSKEILQSRRGAKSLSEDNRIEGIYLNVEITHTLRFFNLAKRTGSGQDIFTSAIARGDLIRDDGRRLIVSKHPSMLTVTDALLLARKRFAPDQPLIINGNADFQRQAAIMAAQMGLKIQCASNKYQDLYLRLQGQHHEYKHNRNNPFIFTGARSGSRGAFSYRAESVGSFFAIPKLTELSGLESLGGSPITGIDQTVPQSRQQTAGSSVHLPQMPGSDVAGVQQRNKMLLQPDSGHSMDIERLSENDNGLRREIPLNRKNGRSLSTAGSAGSVDPDLKSFIDNRNILHRNGATDVCEHQIFTNENGKFEFMGMRNINRKTYALLKQKDIIYVKELSAYAIKRLKASSLHTYVKVLKNGTLEVNGRHNRRK